MERECGRECGRECDFESVIECTTSSSQNSLPGGLPSSSSQNSLPGSGVAGSSQNPMPSGAVCDASTEGSVSSDLSACGGIAGFSGNIGELVGGSSISSVNRQKGGYTCCVPGCYSNTKKNKNLSFHRFPKNNIPKEKWVNAIKRKDFVPTNHHRVCSSHFEGGKRKNTKDVPSVFPLLPSSISRKVPKVREYVPPLKKVKKLTSAEPVADHLVEEIVPASKTMDTLQDENESLKLALEKQKVEL